MDDIPTSLSHYTALVQASGRARAYDDGQCHGTLLRWHGLAHALCLTFPKRAFVSSTCNNATWRKEFAPCHKVYCC